jgi:hypothetical protein
MKTAMQELIDYMKGNFHLSDYSLMMLDHFLKKEKEQIVEAHNQGIWPEPTVYDDGKEYYNKKYNQNSQ